MEWLLTLGISILGVGGTLAGGYLGNRSVERRWRAEIKERADADAARIAREEKLAASEKESADRAEATKLAAQVVEEFSRDLDEVRAFREVDDDGFRTWFEEEWRTTKEVALRRVVGRVRDDADRALLTEVVDALAVQSEFTRWNSTRTPRRFVEDVLLLGLDVAMTMERAQDQSADIIARRAELANRIGAWEHYIAVKEAHEWEEERRAFKLEELQWEADLEAAQEAQEEYEREMAAEAERDEEADQEARDAACGAEELMHTYDEEPDYADDPRDR